MESTTSESEKNKLIPGPAHVVEVLMSAPDGAYSMYPSLKCSE